MSQRIALTTIILFLILHSANAQKYIDGRPEATKRMDATDIGVVMFYGDGPDNCDMNGGRDVWVFKANDSTFCMHYDAAGPKDLNKWNPQHKAIVIDGQNCKWSSRCIGLPSVVSYKNRLAIFYDAPGGESVSHMRRSVGLAWLELPPSTPK